MVVKESILVVDDSADTREVLQRNLTSKGYRTYSASSVAEALVVLQSAPIDLVITDVKMPGQNGFDLLRHVRENLNDTEVVIFTGYPTYDQAVRAVKKGAEEYLAKPFTDEELFAAVKNALNTLHTRRKVKKASVLLKGYGLIGESPSMREVIRAIEKAATTSATILIQGESGTGKEVVARAIHYSSKRASAQFVPVNCGSIPEQLLENELFGHIKGAFTGAAETRAGFFQTADKGTILLDEISEASLSMQVKLLRVLQDCEVCMLGSNRLRKVDVRIIASTNKDLFQLTKTGIFREDLFYRLNVIFIPLPPLRERNDDIYLLINHFVEKYSKQFAKPAPHISDEAFDVLVSYQWPGNVRELENVIQRLVVMCEGDIVSVPDLPSLMRFSALRAEPVNRTLAEVEAEYIQKVLMSVHGNKTSAAKILGLDRKTLREKLRKSNTHTLD